MPGEKGKHYLTQEPHNILNIAGDPFSLFYDYDQIRDNKLSALKPLEKAIWLKARIDMILIEPLHQLFDESSDIFWAFMLISQDRKRNCSFSIAAMVIMLNGVESLGGFLRPDIPDRQRGANKKRFLSFLNSYMNSWIDIADVLWRHFRNGIAHGFQIRPPHSLEFLENTSFESKGNIIYVCPLHFFKDLEKAVREYFESLSKNEELLKMFQMRFDEIYPSQGLKHKI